MKPPAYYHPWGLTDPTRYPVEVLGETTNAVRVRILDDGTGSNRAGEIVRAPKDRTSIVYPETLEDRAAALHRVIREARMRGYREGVAETRAKTAHRALNARLGGIRLAARTAQQAGHVDAAWAIRELLPVVERRVSVPGMDGEGI